MGVDQSRHATNAQNPTAKTQQGWELYGLEYLMGIGIDSSRRATNRPPQTEILRYVPSELIGIDNDCVFVFSPCNMVVYL
jgi:hypothetical protein